jgi:type III pantothenate kinase
MNGRTGSESGGNLPLVAVDIGNRQIKLGVFDGTAGDPLPRASRTATLAAEADPGETIATWLPAPPAAWLVASVHDQAETRLRRWVAQHRSGDSYRLLANAQLPIPIRVDVPELVGTDRLAAAVAANCLRTPGRPAVVIDAGSAITVDLVSADGAFEGGVILPGFGLIAHALARGTDRLPLVDDSRFERPPPVIGKSTEAAIRSGLFWGNVGAVREIVARMTDQLGVPPQIFVVGGDARVLASCLASDVLQVRDLILSGIAVTWNLLSGQAVSRAGRLRTRGPL